MIYCGEAEKEPKFSVSCSVKERLESQAPCRPRALTIRSQNPGAPQIWVLGMASSTSLGQGRSLSQTQ